MFQIGSITQHYTRIRKTEVMNMVYMCNTVLKMQHFIGCSLKQHLVYVSIYIYVILRHS
jgi:hypothetical protein